MKLMQVWIVCFVVFFVAAELYQWLQGITLPLPVFGIAGALLAVASNAQILFHKQNSLQPVQPLSTADSPAVEAAFTAQTVPEVLPPTTAPSPRYYPGVQLPDLTSQAGRSISFTVQNPKPVSEAENLGKAKD